MNGTSEPRLVLGDLPVAARLTLAVFLISVALGYAAALVQLKLQHARPGQYMPTPEDTEKIFTHPRKSDRPISKLEKLLIADENLPFNGGGEMSRAFTKRSVGWKKDIKNRAKKLRRGTPNEADLEAAEKTLRAERNGEREGMVAWIRDGANKDDYEQDKYCLPDNLAKQPITPKYVEKDSEGKTLLKIKSLMTDRCIRCHAKDGEDAKAAQFPLEKPEQIAKYTSVESGGAMSLDKLAQTTHVHLLGFAVLYCLTGLILAFTSWSGWIRIPLAPLPLLFQVIDICLWWLARMDEPYGHMLVQGIPITGAIVGASLGLQLLLSLFDLFGRAWKFTLFVLIALAIGGGYGLKLKVIDPHLAREREQLAPKAKDAKDKDQGEAKEKKE
jgi:hypothetical protein